MDVSDALDNAASSLEMLAVAVLAHETGWGNAIDGMGRCELCCEDEYQFAMDGIDTICDFVDYRGEDETGDEDTAELHFSTKAMMRYYSLCHKYEKCRRISQKNNPYRQRAEQAVREHMQDGGCYYVNYTLQVSPKGKWGNRIVFEYSNGYFTEYLALFSRLLYVFAFYRDTAKELQMELKAMETRKKGKVLPFPKVKQQKRRAA